jgi:hypothetical protein
MTPKHPAEAVGHCNRKSSIYVRIKHSRPNHVHVTVAKVVRESNSVRHHHVASLGEVRHSGRHADGRYKFALGVRETLWQWVENILASEHFEAATAVEFRDAVAKKRRPRTDRRQPQAVALGQALKQGFASQSYAHEGAAAPVWSCGARPMRFTYRHSEHKCRYVEFFQMAAALHGLRTPLAALCR